MFEPGSDTRLPIKIFLTHEEEAFLSEICFRLPEPPDSARERTLDAASALARSLIARNGVPNVRWRYFTDPELNVGAGCSRKDAFHDAGIDGSDILLDPRFLPMLHYWLFGPDLPPDVINWFFVAATQHTSVVTLRRIIRQAVRDHDLSPECAADEFFKLALEASLGVDAAWSIRNAVNNIRAAVHHGSCGSADIGDYSHRRQRAH